MKISHVIRSQEFLSSVPKYLNLYEALGLTPPILATLPYVMAADGHKKLSKRDDAKDILDYARQGYLPETMMNFLATLGWNDGTKQEIFTKDELVSKFKLESVQKAGAHFDEHRLLWMNGHWIRNLPTADLYKRALEFWPEETSKFSNTYKKQVLGLIKDRLKYLAELPALTKPFFIEPEPDLTLISSNKQLSNLSQDKLKSILQVTFNKLSSSDFNLKNLTKLLNDLLVETNQGPNVVFSLIRLATTWTASSPNLAESLNVLGKDKTLDRIQKSINFLS
jgi:glutamyl-tRNA synthetase